MSAPVAKRLIVGVDYGTTYSGVAYVWSDAMGIKDIAIMTEWASRGRTDDRNRPKAPSRISYENGGSWGYGIKISEVAYAWTKLLLDRVKLTDFDDSNLRAVDPGLLSLPDNKTAEQVAADFLTKLYTHTMEHLESKVGKNILDVTKIDFYFSMPAVWSDRAQIATRNAAKTAGFGTRSEDKIVMVREPEAATVACLNRLIEHDRSSVVQEGEGVLMCDCGGGTVDLSSYEVVRSFPRLKLNETCVNEGGKCGSTSIDRAFHDLLKRRFGAAFERIPQKRKGIGSPLMNQFEIDKEDFGWGSSSDVYRYPLVMDVLSSEYYERVEDDDGIFRGYIVLSYNDMFDLFKPVIDKIKALLDNQIKATERIASTKIKTILLAGGFGRSRHLYTELKAWCPEDITLLNPLGSWEAICVGAALRGLEGPIIDKRKCKQNYGICISKPFRPGIDSEANSFVDPFTDEKKANGYMNWIFEKGEDIYNHTVKSEAFYNLTTEAANNLHFPIEFFHSNMALAPERKDHQSVQKQGELMVNLSQVDMSIFPTKRLSRGNVLATAFLPSIIAYAIDFEIRTKVIDESIGLMSFEAWIQGQARGSVEMQVTEENNSHSAVFE